MEVGCTCPKCGAFDIRTVGVPADDLQAFFCHDCGHSFYVADDTIQREHDDRVAGKVTELPEKQEQLVQRKKK
jgi:transposase-like protein